ncbi:MAG: hypothetical protein KBD56_04855 [Candidatus Eisenbacteria bacterium]|nr:hypothetical protein [Candidatus Eisenbacteria bacterium]
MSSDTSVSMERGRGDDLSFVRRVLVTTAWLGALIALAAAVYRGWYWALSFSGGAVIGALNLVFLTVLVREVVRLGQRRWGTILSVLALKMPLVYGGLALLLIWRKTNAAAVMIGFSLPLVVIVLKAAGRALVQSGLFGGRTAGKAAPREDDEGSSHSNTRACDAVLLSSKEAESR